MNKKKLEAKFKEYHTSFDTYFKKYEVMLSDDTDKAFYKKEQEIMAIYIPVVDKIFKLSDDGKNTEAKTSAYDHGSIVGDMVKTLEEHMAYNQTLAKNDAKEAMSAKSSATTIMIGLSLMVALAVIVLVIIIRNNIMNGVFLIRDGIAGFVQNKELKFRINYGKK
nr:MCP four helix bundle domain-containing protein [Sulfurospirillum diekertiae]